MKRTTLVAAAVAAGLAVTAVTGLVVQRGLLGATHYGYPLAWLIRRVLAPEYFPWRVQWLGLVFDALFWTVLAFAVLYLVDSARRGTAGPRSG